MHFPLVVSTRLSSPVCSDSVYGVCVGSFQSLLAGFCLRVEWRRQRPYWGMQPGETEWRPQRSSLSPFRWEGLTAVCEMDSAVLSWHSAYLQYFQWHAECRSWLRCYTCVLNNCFWPKKGWYRHMSNDFSWRVLLCVRENIHSLSSNGQLVSVSVSFSVMV